MLSCGCEVVNRLCPGSRRHVGGGVLDFRRAGLAGQEGVEQPGCLVFGARQ